LFVSFEGERLTQDILRIVLLPRKRVACLLRTLENRSSKNQKMV